MRCAVAEPRAQLAVEPICAGEKPGLQSSRDTSRGSRARNRDAVQNELRVGGTLRNGQYIAVLLNAVGVGLIRREQETAGQNLRLYRVLPEVKIVTPTVANQAARLCAFRASKNEIPRLGLFVGGAGAVHVSRMRYVKIESVMAVERDR